MLPSLVVRGRRNPLHFRLALRLRQARQQACLSFESIASAAGLSAGTTVFNIERKPSHTPRLDTAEKIAYALGLSPAFLAYGLDGECLPGEVLRADGVGSRLQQTRLARGLSALALAKLANTSHTAVGNIEKGGTVPTVATAEALAMALGISPGWLAYGVGDKDPPVSRRGRPAAQSAAPVR